MSNPFQARKKPSDMPQRREPTPPPVVPSEGVTEPSRAELEDMRKAELQALARERNVSDEGTKAELVDRLAP